jgi:putative oxidoreductase
MTTTGRTTPVIMRLAIAGGTTLIGALERVPAALPVLLLRCAVALVFWRSGLTKLPLGNDMTVFLFEDEYRVPLLPAAFAAYLTTLIELIAPWSLIVGLGARVSAAILLAETLVIQVFVYPQHYPEHLLWAGPLLYVVLRGPGKWSVDHFIRHHYLGEK